MRASEGNTVPTSSIPEGGPRLRDALRSGRRRGAVEAVLELRREGLGVDAVAAQCVDHVLRAGGGLLRGSRFGRVPEVLAAIPVLGAAVGEDAAWDVATAAADLLAVAVPPAPTAAAAVPGSLVWASRTEDWGRPALTAGAVARLDAWLGPTGLTDGLRRSFPPPRRPPLHRHGPWVDPSPDGVVLAATALFRARPGFREAAAVLVAREAWADGSAIAVAAAASFAQDTRDHAPRRRGSPAPAGPPEAVDDAVFREALADAATREAVHSFGVVHALAAALAELAREGSRPVAAAARSALIASRPTQSPARPPGATLAARKYRA